MWKPTLSNIALLLLSTTTSSALPQDTLPPTLSWSEKVDALRAHILSQPPITSPGGFSNGPSYQLTFLDTDCHQIRLYNWDCTIAIPYKPAGIASWMDAQNFRAMNWSRFDEAKRWYSYGYYRDPDDGWGLYDVARLAYGACGNRGPQSACGHVYCTGKGGEPFNASWAIPQGHTPWQDPNDRDRVCTWLRGVGVVGPV